MDNAKLILSIIEGDDYEFHDGYRKWPLTKLGNLR